MQQLEIERVRLTLPRPMLATLQAALQNERTLSANWVRAQGWRACHLDDANLVRYTALALVRCCRQAGLDRMYVADPVDIFRSIGGVLEARVMLLNLDGISQICFGLPENMRNNDDYEWFLDKALGVSLFFAPHFSLQALLMRDASTCTTIAGNQEFLRCMVICSRRVWYEGIPDNGLSYGENRIVYQV